MTLAGKASIERDQWNSKLPRVSEFPFSSERKRMSVISQIQEVATGNPGISDVDPYVMMFLLFCFLG